jgi:radical SAM protein with 4Fe4S-binding SPASM domain
MKDKDIIINSFYNRTFFNSWQQDEIDNYNNIELVTTDACSLACKYCYFAKYGDKLFTPESRDPDNIFEGFKKVLEWMTRNNYHPVINFFSGEFFQQEVNVKIIYYLLDHIPPGVTQVVIPVGGSFMLYNDGSELIELQKKFKEKGVYLSFSLSVDGKYMDQNRPVKDKSPRDDTYYDKIFKFAKETRSGFHPMVYSEGIENWEKNFLWFQEKFKEFGLPWSNIYLLDVRNNNWSDTQLEDFGKFIKFLVHWLWDKSKQDKDVFMRNIFQKGNFNILGGPFGTIGRGIGCGIQGNFLIRLGDLSSFPCHRLMRDIFKIGEFNQDEEGKLTDLKADNIELGILIKSTDRKSWPHCETCLIKNLCVGQCLGSCHETHGDVFAPIPVVCKLEHIKLFSIIEAFKEIDIYKTYLDRVGSDKANSIINIGEQLQW